MVWTVCPPTCERMSLSFKTSVLKLWIMCPHGLNHMSLDFKSYILKLLNKCPYTKKRMSLSSNRMPLRIFTCVLTFADICPHGSNHKCLCFKPFVLTLMDLYPHGIQHILLCSKQVIILIAFICVECEWLHERVHMHSDHITWLYSHTTPMTTRMLPQPRAGGLREAFPLYCGHRCVDTSTIRKKCRHGHHNKCTQTWCISVCVLCCRDIRTHA